MTGRLVTEIFTVRSLQELLTRLEEEFETYLSQKEEYSERLGNFLREAEAEHGDEDWFKQLDLDKLGKSKGGSKKNDKKKGKKKKGSDWIQFLSIELCTSLQGEAELMFDALSEIAEKLENLGESREAVEELRKAGLGNDVTYICYLENGVLEKIVLKPIDDSALDRFTFNRGFTILQSIQ